MFIRFRQTQTRLQVSLIRTHRVDGTVRHEHVAMLGTVDAPPSAAERLVFWQRLHERMAKLGNRIDAATQAKLYGDIHARIPMVIADEVRALLLRQPHILRLALGPRILRADTAAVAALALVQAVLGDWKA